MVENTVLLSLEKYDRLIEDQKKINKPRKKTILIQRHSFVDYLCETDDEATAKLAKDLKETKAALSEAKEKLNGFELDFENIKQMTWREFKKWKRCR